MRKNTLSKVLGFVFTVVVCAIITIAAFLLAHMVYNAAFGTEADAAMIDCIDATCRVKTTGRNTNVGTGVVFEISNGKVHVLTNAHVAKTSTMKLRFWRDGHQLDAVEGTTFLRDRDRDVAR